MRSTRHTKRQIDLFLSHLTDDNLNKGASNESKIYGRHYAKIVVFPREAITHLLRLLMMKRNGQSNSHRMSCELQTKIL